jgi:hypothetical protein
MDPLPALAPVIPPVIVPMVQEKLLGRVAVKVIFGLLPLQTLASLSVEITGIAG